MESNTNQDPSALESELESFQQRLAEQFQDLSAVGNDELLSIPWISKLLDLFLGSLEDFRLVLLRNRAEISKPPLDRLVDEFFEKSVKALDICNAARDGIEKVRQWQRHLDIALSALGPPGGRSVGEAQIRRARKALVDLALAMLDDRDNSSSGGAFSHRNRSFGRHNPKKHHHQLQHQTGSGSGSGSGSGHARSLSWSVSHSWSAAKQLQSISGNLVPPRGNEIAATNGLASPVFAMSFVLAFAMWAVVAAIPCQQDRGGLAVHLTAPKGFPWGPPLGSVLTRIVEESKRRGEHKNASSNGLLREIYQLERCARQATDLVDSVQFPLADDQVAEIDRTVDEVRAVYEAFHAGLDPLERQVREVFRKIMACRTEGLDILNRGNALE